MISDKGKLIIMYALIAFILIILSTFIIVGILNLEEQSKEKNKEVITTTIQELSTSTTSTSTTPISTTSTSTSTTLTKVTSTKINQTTKKKANAKVTTKRTSTTSKAEVIYNERETTESNSTYPNALDSWEWEIVDTINEARKNNGLNELSVAVDLRRLAEEAADFWYDYNKEEIAEYLDGYSHYGYKSNALDNMYGYKTLYNATIQNTNVISNAYLKYLGIGVIEHEQGIGGLKTYYYIIIYE